MGRRAAKASKDAIASLGQAPVAVSCPDESFREAPDPPILDTSPSASMVPTHDERKSNEELEAKWEARLKTMEAWQLATEEKLKFALAENAKLNMNPPNCIVTAQRLKAPKDIMPESRAISRKSRPLFEDGNGNLVPREKLYIGQAMRRSLLALPHFKGVDLRAPHFHVYVEKDTRVSIYDHLHILSVLMHVIQARKMTPRNVNPNGKYFFCVYCISTY